MEQEELGRRFAVRHTEPFRKLFKQERDTIHWCAIDGEVDSRINFPLTSANANTGKTHLFLFLQDYTPRADVVALLKRWAPHANIFYHMPHGEWPYRDDQVEFLSRVHPITLAKAQAIEVDLLPDAPPCLRRIQELGGFDDLTKWNGMYNVGVYLRKKYSDPDAVGGLLTKCALRLCRSTFSLASLTKIHREVFNNDADYKCHELPIRNYCDKDACKQCPFGKSFGVDSKNTNRLLEKCADIRYAPDHGWIAWNGRYWQETEISGPLVQAIEEMAEEGINDRSIHEWATKSLSPHRVSALARQLQGRLTVDRLDVDPHLLSVANGTIDLRTGELLPHNRAHFITKLVPIEYHPETGSDAEPYLRRVCGYALTGETREDCVFALQGPGARQLLRIMSEILGPYIAHVRYKNFAGKRLVVGDKLTEGLVREFTNVMGPTAKLWVDAECPPRMNGIAPVYVPEMNVEDPLEFLAWAVQGAVDWYRNGTRFVRNGDLPLDILIQDSSTRTSIDDAYQAYVDWCAGFGMKPKPNTKFQSFVKSHYGVDAVRPQSDDQNRPRFFHGLKLISG